MQDKVLIILAICVALVSLYCVLTSNSNTSERFTGDDMFRITFTSSWGSDPDLKVPEKEKPHTGTILMYMWHLSDDNQINKKLALSQRNKHIASDGLKRSAELGMSDKLIKELENYPEVSKNFITDGSIETPVTKSWDVQLDKRFPMLTFVTMIAPSADWFVAETIDLNLYATKQSMKPLSVPLYVMDAGTDEDPGDQLVTFPKHPRDKRIPTALLGPDSKLYLNRKVKQIGYLSIEKIKQ